MIRRFTKFLTTPKQKAPTFSYEEVRQMLTLVVYASLRRGVSVEQWRSVKNKLILGETDMSLEQALIISDAIMQAETAYMANERT